MLNFTVVNQQISVINTTKQSTRFIEQINRQKKRQREGEGLRKREKQTDTETGEAIN